MRGGAGGGCIQMGSEYFAPSKVWSELTGIPLHNDWGLTDHANWQNRLIPDGSYRSKNPRVIQEVLQFAPESLSQYDPYHVAFGMISQFTENDIAAFCSGSQAHESWSRARPIESRWGESIQWVPSEETFALLESI